MDISSLYNISSGAIKEVAAAKGVSEVSGIRASSATGQTAEVIDDNNAFSTMLSAAIDNINTTNSYLSDAENEELKLSLGVTDNTHDLTVALQKASTALQYTVAVRDRFLEAYKEIMQIQI